MKKYHVNLLKLSLAALLSAAPAVFAQEPAVAIPEPAPAVAVPEPAPAIVAAPEPAPAIAATPAPAPAPAKAAGGLKVSLYGFFQINGVYEDGANGGNNWSFWVPKKAEDGEGRLLLNVNQTRIGINVSGEPKESGAELSGKFESDFANNNARNNNGVGSLRIRQAYGQVKFSDIGLSLLFGQTSDLIAPLTAPSLNQGNLQSEGSLGTRRPMVRVAQALGPLEIAAAATDNRDATAPVLPAFQGSLKAKIPAVWAGEKQNVEFILSGHYASREIAAEDSAGVEAKKDSAYKEPPTSWSGVASLSLPVVSIINLSGELFYGQNLSSYSNGSIGQGSSGQPAALTKSKNGVQSLGGWGAATVKLPAGFALAGGYGVEAVDKDREPDNTNADVRIKNSVVFANLKYFVDEAAFIGFEYASLSTDYLEKGDAKHEVVSGKLNRFELVFNYAFK